MKIRASALVSCALVLFASSHSSFSAQVEDCRSVLQQRIDLRMEAINRLAEQSAKALAISNCDLIQRQVEIERRDLELVLLALKLCNAPVLAKVLPQGSAPQAKAVEMTERERGMICK